jgi:serine/threonine-protein kinase HipA
MSREVLRYAPELAASEVYVGDEREHVLRISDFVSAQAHRLMEMAPHIAKVDPNLL